MGEFFRNAFSMVQSFLYGDDIEDEYEIDPMTLIKNEPWNIPSSVSLDSQVHRRGTITFIGDTFGVIDKVLAFSIELLHGEKLSVGTQVDYTFIPSCTGQGDVLAVSAVPAEDTWEDADDSVNTIETVVRERKERNLVFACGYTCSLDNVNAEFVPLAGDKVMLELEEVRDGENKVKAIRYVTKPRFRTGYVTRFMSCEGEIGHEIKFNLDVCRRGFIPLVQDEVRAEIIPSNQGTCDWRAISVEPLNNRIEAEPEVTTDDIQGDYHSILISGETDFGKIPLEDFSHEIKFEIKNIGTTVQELLGGKFKRKFAQFEVSNLKQKTIAPNENHEVWFRAKPTYVGRHRETFTFNFKGFDISRNFDLMVTESMNIYSSIRTGPYIQPTVCIDDLEKEGEQRTRGARPFSKSRFNKLQPYRVPKKLWDVVVVESGCNFLRDKEIEEKLKEMYPSLKQPLNSANYEEKLHLSVYLEEIYLKMSMMKLSIDNVFFLKRGDYLVLDIPNLAEKRPSLIRGDKIVVTQPLSSKKGVHEGSIYDVTLNSIATILHPSFQDSYDGTICNVRFEVATSMFSHLHNAIIRAKTKLGNGILFPEGLPQRTEPNPLAHITDSSIEWFNPNLNEQQKLAVLNVLRGECRPLPYIIFGPPGTGKTVTVVETVLQICRLSPKNRVLVCGPSNSSADLLAERIIAGGKFKPKDCVRLCAFSRSEESIPPSIEEYCMLFEENEGQGGGIDVGHHRITVGTCTVVTKLHLLSLPRGHFTHVVIDEAGYAHEPEALVPLSFLDPKSGQAVLAGDPLQLGPVLMSPYCGVFGIDGSLLQRLMNRFPYARDIVSYPHNLGYNPRLVTQLVVNYRSVPEILKLPSDLFYHSVLKATVSPDSGREAQVLRAFSEIVNTDRPDPVTILFHGVRGQNCRETDSPSWMNPHELCEALRYIRTLYEIGVRSEEIGVISPYRKQVVKLRQLVNDFQIPVPKVGSVEEFQGQERLVVIMSCVRSTASLLSDDQRLNMGFVKSPQRVNVSLTRARALLIILGNPHLLYTDPCWRAVIQYCVDRNAYIGCDLPELLTKRSVSANEE